MIQPIPHRYLLRLSLVTIAAFLTLVAGSRVSGLPLEDPPGNVPFSLSPNCSDVPVGGEIDLSIQVGASATDPVDTAQASILFDPNALEVVSVSQGTIFGTNGWVETLNQVGVGSIKFTGGRTGESGSNAMQPFQLAVVRFKSLATSPGTGVSFETASSIPTKALLLGEQYTGTVSGATLFSGPVNWNILHDCTITGSVTAPGNVIVESGNTLTINSGATLNIDFATNHLLIKDGAKVVIKDGGKIN